MAKKNFYAVKVGVKSNTIVRTWKECSALVTGHPGAIFKGFINESQAKVYLEGPPPTWKKSKPKPQGKKSSWGSLYPCIERKTYRDLITGILYTNRCVRRRGPTMTGVDYEPTDDDSLPWLTPNEIEDQVQAQILNDARQAGL